MPRLGNGEGHGLACSCSGGGGGEGKPGAVRPFRRWPSTWARRGLVISSWEQLERKEGLGHQAVPMPPRLCVCTQPQQASSSETCDEMPAV